MSFSQGPMRLSQTDLFSPKVDAYLEEQDVLRRAMPEVAPRPLIVRIFFSSYFYLSLASGLGAFLAWALVEPLYDDKAAAVGQTGALQLLLNVGWFALVAAFSGLFLGAIEGAMCRNPGRAALCAAVGLGVGLVGGLVGTIAAMFVYGIMGIIVRVLMANKPNPDGMPTGFALLVQIMGRGAAWAVAALPAGLGQGIALREKKVILNGLLGGVLGGLLGGLLFDPIGLAMGGENGNVSRGVGFTTIGLMVGLFVGIVEQWTKTAWLLMKAGPLAGKQFVIYRNPTVLGSSPKADIYLFKDPAIEPQHALIHNRGGRYELEDCNSADGTYVNGIPVQRKMLQPGDQIVLGKTVLEFSLREAK